MTIPIHVDIASELKQRVFRDVGKRAYLSKALLKEEEALLRKEGTCRDDISSIL